MNSASVSLHRRRRQERTRRLIHKRHELVRKARHGASDADASDVRTSANATHPATLPNITLHHRPPASQLHNTKWRSIFIRKLRLLVESAAVTTLMHGIAKEPRWTQGLIEGNHRCASRCHVEQIQKCLHEVIRLHRTSRHTHDGNPPLRLPFPSQIVGKAQQSRLI